LEWKCGGLPDEVEVIEPLNSYESSLQVAEAFLPQVKVFMLPLVELTSLSPSEGINPILPEETLMASYEAHAIHKMQILLRTHFHNPSLLLEL
jgi:hypothetical protein